MDFKLRSFAPHMIEDADYLANRGSSTDKSSHNEVFMKICSFLKNRIRNNYTRHTFRSVAWFSGRGMGFAWVMEELDEAEGTDTVTEAGADEGSVLGDNSELREGSRRVWVGLEDRGVGPTKVVEIEGVREVDRDPEGERVEGA